MTAALFQSKKKSYLQGTDCFSTISPDTTFISAYEMEISVDKCSEEPLIFLNPDFKTNKNQQTPHTIHLEAFITPEEQHALLR